MKDRLAEAGSHFDGDLYGGFVERVSSRRQSRGQTAPLERAATALLVGSGAQLVGQAVMDVQGRDLRAAEASASLWIVAHLLGLAGVVALSVGAFGLTRSESHRLAGVGRIVVITGAVAAGIILLYDVVLGSIVWAGEELPPLGEFERNVLQFLDSVDFALVIGLVISVMVWWQGAATRRLPCCVALLGLSIPGLQGVQTLAAAGLFAAFVGFAILLPPRARIPSVERVVSIAVVLAFIGAAFVSAPRAGLALLVLLLAIWLPRLGEERRRASSSNSTTEQLAELGSRRDFGLPGPTR